MIDRSHDLPVVRQAALLQVSRSSVYALPRPVPPARLVIMHRIDALHLEHPFAGSRMLRDLLRAEGVVIGRVAVATLMRRMGIENLFSRLKDFARIALRRDKTRRSWMGFAHLAATMINLRIARFSHKP